MFTLWCGKSTLFNDIGLPKIEGVELSSNSSNSYFEMDDFEFSRGTDCPEF
jgi:hypothetical protein